MEQIILVGHLLIALAIIVLIMLQQGKGADMGASFGAGASQTLFGATGTTNILTKATAWLAAAFFASSFGLAMLADSRIAGVDDLGFEIPVESSATEARFEALPEGDLPPDAAGDGEVIMAPVLESDLPTLEDSRSDYDGNSVSGEDDLPEGM